MTILTPKTAFAMKSFGLGVASLILMAASSHQMLNHAQADGFGEDRPTIEETAAAFERCILAPETASHPGTGASILILRPTC